MEEFADHPDAASRSIAYVDPEGVVALNPAVQGDIAGGLTLGAMRSYPLLGTPLPAVARRWEGVCAREEISPGVWLVTGPGGRGMTCAPAIAADTLAAAGVS